MNLKPEKPNKQAMKADAIKVPSIWIEPAKFLPFYKKRYHSIS